MRSDARPPPVQLLWRLHFTPWTAFLIEFQNLYMPIQPQVRLKFSHRAPGFDTKAKLKDSGVAGNDAGDITDIGVTKDMQYAASSPTSSYTLMTRISSLLLQRHR